jgi:hypothetical protein
MSTQRQHRSPSPIRGRAALAGVIAALAIAAPVAGATAATPRAVDPSGAQVSTVSGPILSADVFNGGTAIVTSPSSAVGIVVGSPSPRP